MEVFISGYPCGIGCSGHSTVHGEEWSEKHRIERGDIICSDAAMLDRDRGFTGLDLEPRHTRRIRPVRLLPFPIRRALIVCNWRKSKRLSTCMLRLVRLAHAGWLPRFWPRLSTKWCNAANANDAICLCCALRHCRVSRCVKPTIRQSSTHSDLL